MPFDGDVELVFHTLQERELAAGHFYWQDDDGGEAGDLQAQHPWLAEIGSVVPLRPTSLAHLADIKDDEQYEFWTWGTHSILDMDRVLPANAEDGDGTLRPLSSEELRDLLGTDMPSDADFEAAYESSGVLGVADFCWNGRYTMLYREGQPVELAFWGISGD